MIRVAFRFFNFLTIVCLQVSFERNLTLGYFLSNDFIQTYISQYLFPTENLEEKNKKRKRKRKRKRKKKRKRKGMPIIHGLGLKIAIGKNSKINLVPNPKNLKVIVCYPQILLSGTLITVC